MASLKALADFTKKGDTQGTDYSHPQIDQIKEMTIEQDSLEVDRMIGQPKPAGRFEKSMSVLEKKSDQYLIPQRLNADSALAGPIKEFNEKEITAEFKPKLDLKNGVKMREIRRLENRYTSGSKEAPRTNKFMG